MPVSSWIWALVFPCPKVYYDSLIRLLYGVQAATKASCEDVIKRLSAPDAASMANDKLQTALRYASEDRNLEIVEMIFAAGREREKERVVAKAA